MRSHKAKEFIDGCMDHLTVEMSDHAKWQLRAAMTHTAELAEQEMEEKLTRWNDPKIEERAKAYHKELARLHKMEAQCHYFIERAFTAGAKSEREELLRWREMM